MAATGGIRPETRQWRGRSVACVLVLTLMVSPATGQFNTTTIRIGLSVRLSTFWEISLDVAI
jgi:hypothetical protein